MTHNCHYGHAERLYVHIKQYHMELVTCALVYNYSLYLITVLEYTVCTFYSVILRSPE